jgi:hypothetical protein
VASPAQGQLSEKALEVILGILGVKSMVKGKGKAGEAPEPANADLKDLVGAKREAPQGPLALPRQGDVARSDMGTPEPNMQAMADADANAKSVYDARDQFEQEQAHTQPYEKVGIPDPLKSELGAAEPKAEGEPGIDYFPDNPTAEMDAYKQRQVDEAWDQRKKEQEAVQKAEWQDDKTRNTPLDEKYEPTQSSGQREKSIRPISNRGPMARQRGAVDVSFLDPREWFDKGELEKHLRDVAKVSTSLFRKYGPNVDLGPDRTGRIAALQSGKGKLPIPILEVEKIGDHWTVVNHDGRSRSDMFSQLGEKDMPVRVKDKSGQFRHENPKEIRSQDMQTMLPNPWYTKGDVGDFVKAGLVKQVGETSKAKVVYRASAEGEKVKPGQWVTPDRDVAHNVYAKGTAAGRVISDALPAKDLYEVHPGGWIYAPEGTNISPVIRHGTTTMGDMLKNRKLTGYEDAPRYDGRTKDMKEAESAVNRKLGQTSFGKGQRGSFDISSLFKNKAEKADFDRARALVARDDRTAGEFIKAIPLPTKDITPRVGLASGTFRTKRELGNNINDKSHAIHTLNYLVDNMHLLKEETERLIVEQVHPAKMALMGNYRSRFSFTFDHDAFKQDMSIVKQFEKSPEAWRLTPEQWSPVKAQLKAAGLSDRAADAWGQYYKAVEDVLWPQVAQFAESKGIHPPDRVPGWLPHFTQGAWKVQLYRELDSLDEHGMPKIERLATVGAKGREEAETMHRNLERYAQGHEGEVKVRIIEPSTGGDMASILEGLFEMKDRMKLNKGLTHLIERAFEQASIGQLKNALERKSNPQILHQLDRVVNKDEFQLSKEDARQALNQMTDIMEYIPTMNMRAKFLTEHFFPLQMAGYFENMPHMRKAALEYTQQFLRISDNTLSFFDNFVSNAFIKQGWDPKIGKDVVSALQGSATAFYLMYRPAFWAVQGMQKVANQGLLWTANAELRMAGLNVSSPTIAILKSGIIPSRLAKTVSGETIRHYAEKTGASEPIYVENMSARFLADPIAKMIERQTRTAAVETTYFQLKQGLPEKDALNASTRLSKEMNIDYSQELGKPTLFTKLGQWLSPIGMFMQYSFHQMQMIAYQTSVLKRAGAEKNLLAAKDAMTGLAYNLAMMGVMGGILGLPFAPQINSAIKSANEEFGWMLPTAVSFARDLTKKMKEHNFGDDVSNFAGRVAEFGLYSDVVGFDISGSARGPTLQEPNAFPHFLRLMADLGILGGKMLQPYGVSNKELNDTIKTMPQSVRGALSEYISNGRDVGKTAESIKDLVTGQKEDYASMPNDPNLKGTYKRSQADSIGALAGLKSISRRTSEDHQHDLTNPSRTSVVRGFSLPARHKNLSVF